MKTISKRELNQQTAHVLEAVSGGQAVLVTERGVPRWRIEAVEDSGDPVVRLRLGGRITRPKPNPAAWPTAVPRYTPSQVDALFAESRGER
jgi:antitoxin (DNA-binding transcriptional repressor) of toxin-antitoxin stability system